MKARLALVYIPTHEVAHVISETLDFEMEAPLSKGDTIFLEREGAEWSGECTSVHHLFTGKNCSHMPMYWLKLTFKAKLK